MKNGQYQNVAVSEGISDFLGQLKQDQGADMAAPELPFELLRRASRYEVRRYPSITVAETEYEQRPEGYDRLGEFCSEHVSCFCSSTYLLYVQVHMQGDRIQGTRNLNFMLQQSWKSTILVVKGRNE